MSAGTGSRAVIAGVATSDYPVLPDLTEAQVHEIIPDMPSHGRGSDTPPAPNPAPLPSEDDQLQKAKGPTAAAKRGRALVFSGHGRQRRPGNTGTKSQIDARQGETVGAED